MMFPDIDQTSLLTPNLATVLGIRFIPTEAADECVATMPVNETTRQPFGFLSGGATLAFAEMVAGAGSMVLRPECVPLGINVSGAHANSVAQGHTVTAVARLIKEGHHLHIWNVIITDDDNRVISTVTVTNYLKTIQQ